MTQMAVERTSLFRMTPESPVNGSGNGATNVKVSRLREILLRVHVLPEDNTTIPGAAIILWLRIVLVQASQTGDGATNVKVSRLREILLRVRVLLEENTTMLGAATTTLY
jgi:hypothetical protein